MLDKFITNFGVQDSFQKEQIKLAAEFIVRDYYWYSIADFKIFMDKCLRGELGSSYNNINMERIFGWLRQYDEIRTVICEGRSQIEATSMKSRDFARDWNTEKTDKILKQTLKKL